MTPGEQPFAPEDPFAEPDAREDFDPLETRAAPSLGVGERVLAAFAPGWAVQRQQARLALRAYEAVRPSKQRRPKGEHRSPNAATGPAIARLRGQGRWFEQNSDLASGILAAAVDNIVGTGIVTNPAVRMRDGTLARDVNRKLRRLHAQWANSPKDCDTTAQHTWGGMQRLACRSMLRDGETFGQLVRGDVFGLPKKRKIALAVEMLEADLVPVELNEPDNRVFQGIRFNAFNRPQEYYVHKSHPGSIGMYPVALNTKAQGLKTIDARDVVHCKLQTRFGQARGISIFATISKRLFDIGEIEEAERVAARVAASMSAYIKKGIPDNYQPPRLDENGKPVQGMRHMKMSPGAIFDQLLPGEDVGTINSSRPNNELIPFRQSQLKAIAAGASVNYSTIARDYSGTYSSQRQSLIEAFMQYRPMTALVIAQLVQPVYAGFIEAALTGGLLSASELDGVDMDTLTNADHFGPAMPAIDPLKEANANISLVEANQKTLQQCYSERGQILDDALPQLEYEQDQLAEAGLLPTQTKAADEGEDPNTSSDGQPEPKAA